MNLKIISTLAIFCFGYISCECSSKGSVIDLINSMSRTLTSLQCSISSSDQWPNDYGPTALRHGKILEDFDFIVVGAGSAGSVVASRLSENPKWKVLLIEAGKNPPIESEIPALFSSMWMTTEYSYRYKAEKSSNFGLAFNNGIVYPSGKVLGGTSAVNGMLYVRGVPEDFDNWNVEGWTYDEVLPYFKKSEANRQIKDTKYHGLNGTLVVDNFPDDEAIKIGLLNGIKGAGYKILNDINSDEHVGFTLAQGTLKDGERCSSAKAFLSPAKDRPNMKVIKNAFVSKLIISGNKVRGVYFDLNGTTMRAYMRKEVILSAGVFGSPKILMLSGIGKNSDLSPFKIPQIKDLPVGYNLHDHVMASMRFSFLKSVAPDDNIFNYYSALYTYLTEKKGPYAGIGCGNLLGFISTKNLTIPDSEFFFYCLPKKTINFDKMFQALNYKDEFINQFVNLNNENPIILTNNILLQPKSRGTVKLRSSKFSDPPVINPNFLDSEDDVTTLITGIRTYRKLLTSKNFEGLEIIPLRDMIPECDKLEFDSDDYWRCYLKYFLTSEFHPVGTCKMGNKDDQSAVLLPDLRVRGVHNLRVVDASVMPNVIKGHTNAATIMIAEKASDMIKNFWNTN